MAPPSLLLNHPLPRSAVELGRLVLHPENPEADFCQPDAIPPDTEKQPLADLKHTLDSESGFSLKLSLARRLSLSGSPNTHDSTNFSSHSFVGYQLRNSGDYFRTACGEANVRSFLEKQAESRFGSAFLVSGFKTLEDANVKQTHKRDRNFAADVDVPLPLPVPVDLAVDVDLVAAQAEVTRRAKESVEYKASGEQVFAVQYRKVRFSWFAADKVDSAHLEPGNRWRLYGTMRGEAGDEGIEADLDEDISPHELVPGECDSLYLEGETFILPVADEEED